jgi:uncharacterized protein (DUF934 family)
MLLLDAAGAVTTDNWIAVADEADIPAGPAIIPLARFLREAETLTARNAPLGVLLASNAKPDAIADVLDRLDVIAIEFPKFRDGRGFTIARTLRERYGYKGEIRAVGHILPDQALFLLRSGFTTFVPPEGQNLDRWAELIARGETHEAEAKLPLLRRSTLPFSETAKPE